MTQGRGTYVSIFRVVPQQPPNWAWIWHRPASLPLPAQVRIGLWQFSFPLLGSVTKACNAVQ